MIPNNIAQYKLCIPPPLAKIRVYPTIGCPEVLASAETVLKASLILGFILLTLTYAISIKYFIVRYRLIIKFIKHYFIMLNNLWPK